MKKGFSLIEIIVSIAIIGILSVIGVQVFTSSVQRARFESDVAQVLQALRQSQNDALAPPISEIFGVNPKTKLCSVGVRITQNGTIKTIQPIYTTPSGTVPCGSGLIPVNYPSPPITLSHVNIGTDININVDTIFEFEPPFAGSAQKDIVLTSLDGNISKTITVM
ncbi:MAG: prepilin-type N-terminal cleavage/methylation domain-containing protein, partial [Minisyncoccia bacterium]